MTVFEGVPTMYAALLHAPGPRTRYDVSSLRCCVSGGAALPVEVLHGFERAFGCVVLEGYGLSETSPVACFNHPDRERMPGSIGTPVEGVEMRLLDATAGAAARRGRRDRHPRPQRDEGLLATARRRRPRRSTPTAGSAPATSARVDADGCYFIVDRKKDLIIRGGYNVYPREIEEVLYEHPAVREAAVVGIPHPELGEEVGAAVALKAGAGDRRGAARATSRRRSRPTSTRGTCGSSTRCRRAPTGKILKREIVAPARGAVMSAAAADGRPATGARAPRAPRSRSC